jgi:hypothetical protein
MVGLMAVAAPWIAACIQSLYIFYKFSLLYNAQLGGVYFGNMDCVIRLSPEQIHAWIAGLIGRYAFLSLPTFLVLLPFRRLPLYCWIIWSGSICACMILFWMAEVVLK